MIAEEAKTLLSGVVTHLPDLWAKRGDSLSEFTRVTRNDFLTLIESDLVTLDYLPDILDTAHSLVAGYYLSAVSLLVDIPEINVRRTLDQVSTKRDPVESILGSGAAAFKFVGTESYEFGLPAMGTVASESFAMECFALEAKQRSTKPSTPFVDLDKDVDEWTKRKLDIQSSRLRNTQLANQNSAFPDESQIRQLNIQKLQGDLARYSKENVDRETAYSVARLAEINQRIRLSEEAAKNSKISDAARRQLEDEKFAYQREKDKTENELKEKGLDLQKLNHDLSRERFEFEKQQAEKGTSGFGFGRDALATIEELSNLSIGKLIEVNFERNGNRMSVPVTIRLAVTDTDSASMRTILSVSGIQNTFGERWRRMRSGELAMVKDLLFSHDLIAESRRMRVRDKSGFYEHMMRRQSRNFLSGLFSLNPSINNASAVLIASEDTAKAATLELGGPLSDFKIREKVFKSTAAMLFFVVDTKWDTVTIYHRGVDAFSTVTVNDLRRRKGKNGGSGVSDIISAYQAGAAPTI